MILFKRLLATIIILSSLVFIFGVFKNSISAIGQFYYVDSVNGSDSNSGTSITSPWKTLAPVNGHSYSPGDTINFKRGSLWTGILTINSSGVQGNPIKFTAYGTGNRPVIENPTNIAGQKKLISIRSNYVIVEGFLLRNGYYSNGVEVTGKYNIIQDLDISGCKVGVNLSGTNNLVTKNTIHDNVNTENGYGAVGFNVTSSYNEISYNTIKDNMKTSTYFGMDGGAIELYGTVDGTYIHHNLAQGNRGFLEAGSNGGSGTAKDVTIAYNLCINNDGGFTSIHLAGGSEAEAIAISNFKVENNTVVEMASSMGYQVFGFSNAPASGTFILRNNIFYISNFYFVSDTDRKGYSFIHENNLYYFPNSGSKVGYALGPGEIMGNPLFVNLSSFNLNLNQGSPAIDSGANLGYSTDYDDKAVPSGSAPDIGAYEYGGTIQSTPTPLSTSTPIPTPTIDPCPSGNLGNLNCDPLGKIDDTDLAIFLTLWAPDGSIPNSKPGNYTPDLNHDNLVDEKDLTILLKNWKQ